MNHKLKRAARLYHDFTGHAARTVDMIELPSHDVLTVIGECEAIAYSTVRDGIRERYIHEFRPQSRPVLAVSHDGKQLYLLAGAYRFTDAGITDI